jgi:hypothetical protein
VRDLARKLTASTLCTLCGEVVHVGLEILDDARLASRRDVGTSVVKGECADGRIMCLEDGYKVERQPVPGREFPPTREAGTVHDVPPTSTRGDIRWGKD